MRKRCVIDAIDGIVERVGVLGAAAVQIVEGIVFGVVRSAAFRGGVTFGVNTYHFKFLNFKHLTFTFVVIIIIAVLRVSHQQRIKRFQDADARTEQNIFIKSEICLSK